MSRDIHAYWSWLDTAIVSAVDWARACDPNTCLHHVVAPVIPKVENCPGGKHSKGRHMSSSMISLIIIPKS